MFSTLTGVSALQKPVQQDCVTVLRYRPVGLSDNESMCPTVGLRCNLISGGGVLDSTDDSHVMTREWQRVCWEMKPIADEMWHCLHSRTALQNTKSVSSKECY